MFWRKCAVDQSFHFNSKSFFMDLQQTIMEWDRKCMCMLFSWRCAFGFIIRSHLSTGFVGVFIIIQLISERCDISWDIRRHGITVTFFAVCFFAITCHKILDTGPLFWKKSNIWSKKIQSHNPTQAILPFKIDAKKMFCFVFDKNRIWPSSVLN